MLNHPFCGCIVIDAHRRDPVALHIFSALHHRNCIVQRLQHIGLHQIHGNHAFGVYPPIHIRHPFHISLVYELLAHQKIELVGLCGRNRPFDDLAVKRVAQGGHIEHDQIVALRFHAGIRKQRQFLRPISQSPGCLYDLIECLLLHVPLLVKYPGYGSQGYPRLLRHVPNGCCTGCFFIHSFLPPILLIFLFSVYHSFSENLDNFSFSHENFRYYVSGYVLIRLLLTL